MPDNLTKEQRHNNMSRILSSDTKPEMTLRRSLWHLGFRYRVNDKKLTGKPDIVLSKYRTIIFVHGCFWHGHKGCIKYTVPKTNTDFWKAKIARNQKRDQEVWRQLESKGWNVIVVWECELSNSKLQDTITRVASEIVSNGESYLALQAARREARKTYLAEQRAKNDYLARIKAEIKKDFSK